MSSEEQARVLRMVSEGKLTAEEAADLLDALEPAPRPEYRPTSLANGPDLPIRPRRPVSPNRSLVILIEEGGKSKVDLRIPLALARAAGRFIPRSARARLEEFEIDLSEMLGGIGTAEEGSLLHVEDGESRVQIRVE